MDNFILQTSNAHKVEEYEELLRYFNVRSYKSPKKITENGKTYKENAIIKLKAMQEEIENEKVEFIPTEIKEILGHGGQENRIFLIADDSGLEVSALLGKPGVKTSRFKKNLEPKERFEYIVNQCIKKKDFKASFVCCIAFCQALLEDGEICFSKIKTVEKSCQGKIVSTLDEISKKENSFGYDPIFIANGKTVVFADLPKDEKNEISHRGLAVNKMLGVLSK